LYESALAVSGDPTLQELANEAARNCSSGGDQGDNNDQGSEGESEEPPPESEPTPDNSQPTPLPVTP
jgi:hypothetical protein